MELSRDMLNPPYPIHLKYLVCHITLVRMVQNDSKCCYSAPCTAVPPLREKFSTQATVILLQTTSS